MLCNANRQDRAVFAMWSLKVSWSPKITPRFLTELDGIFIEEPNWDGEIMLLSWSGREDKKLSLCQVEL